MILQGYPGAQIYPTRSKLRSPEADLPRRVRQGEAEGLVFASPCPWRPPLLGPGWPQPRPQAWPQAPAWDGTWQSAAALSATPSQLRGWEWLGGGGRDGPLALAGLPVSASGGATSWRQPAMDPLQWQDGQFFGGHKLGSTCQWTAATSHGGWPGMAAPIPAARSTPLPGQHQGVHHDAGYASGPPGRTTSRRQWEGGWIMEPGRVSPSPV